VARVAEDYRDGDLPPTGCSFTELVAWAVAQERRTKDAATEAASAPPV
jgi:hypothetical protein